MRARQRLKLWKTVGAVGFVILAIGGLVYVAKKFIPKQYPPYVMPSRTPFVPEATPTPTPKTTPAPELTLATPATKIWENSAGYFMANYSIGLSPIATSFGSYCTPSDGYYADSQDVYLARNGKILIPSILKFILPQDKWEWGCTLPIKLFSAPADARYIYLTTDLNIGSDAPYPGLGDIYRIELATLQMKKLDVSAFVRSTDLYRGYAAYKLLSDGKRLLKWNMNGVYLVNLEADSSETLYATAPNRWLISKIVFGMGQIPYYDVQVTDVITVGLYDKTLTADGKAIIIDQYGNVRVEGRDKYSEEDIQPRFITKVLIPLSQ